MEMMLAIFFDTIAHRNAAALALRDKFAGHARMMGGVEDYGVSGPSADDPTAQWQLWASLDFASEVYAARTTDILTVIHNNVATYGVQNVGVNGALVTP